MQIGMAWESGSSYCFNKVVNMHTLEAIQSCSPEAVLAPMSFKLKSDTVSCASDLLAAFADDDTSNTKLNTIQRIACELGLTCEEFKNECKQAQKLADQVDASNGFVASDNERYGIKRRVLNNRLSEAKRLFGVFKAAPAVLKEKGYNAAVIAARQWLLTNNKQWDGSSVPTDSTRETKAAALAFKEATQCTPMQAGESIKDYQARLAPVTESMLASNKLKAQKEAVNKLVKRLAENEDGDTLITACLHILEGQSIEEISDYISYLSEAKIIAQYDQGKEN